MFGQHEIDQKEIKVLITLATACQLGSHRPIMKEKNSPSVTQTQTAKQEF